MNSATKVKGLIRLLVVDDSDNQAERLANLFRNQGSAVRLHRVGSPASLQEALQQDWSLLIAAPHTASLANTEALAMVHRSGLDIPSILLLKGDEDYPDRLIEALKAGASSAAPDGQDELLVRIAYRELKYRDDRRTWAETAKTLQETERRCQLLLDSSVTAVGYIHDGMHIYANPAYQKLFGYASADDLLGIPLMDLISADEASDFRRLLKNDESLDAPIDLTGHCQTLDGKSIPAHVNLSAAHYDGEACLQLIVTEIDQSVAADDKSITLKGLDSLTGLLNRTRLIELIEQALSEDRTFTLSNLRIDNYAVLLARLGVNGTDQLQIQMAHLLGEGLVQGASLARVTDGAFALLLPGSLAEQRAPLAALLKKAQEHLFDIDAQSFQISLSGGAASTEQVHNATRLYDRALDAAYKAGSAKLKFYDPTEELIAAANRGNDAALVKHALNTESIHLLFQPILSLHGGDVNYYEVLPRLLDPQGNEVDTDEIIHATDGSIEAALAVALDRWVLQQAIQQLAEQPSEGRDTRLLVPLSKGSLLDPTLFDWLIATLQEHQLNTNAVLPLIAEATAVSQLKQAHNLCDAMKTQHGGMAISHFGKTSNPLKTLSQLPAELVKIDPTLLQDLEDESKVGRLSSLLTGLNARGAANILPGVDSPTILATLWQAGAEYIQGPYIQAPASTMSYHFQEE